MTGFAFRWLAAAVLVFATYNPTRWNFARWAMEAWQSQLSMVVLAGLVLLTGYIIYLRATFRSIGAFGVALIAALMGAILWVLADNGLLDLDNARLMTWLGLAGLSLVLAIGLSWSIFRRHLTGQADIDDVDE